MKVLRCQICDRDFQELELVDGWCRACVAEFNLAMHDLRQLLEVIVWRARLRAGKEL